MVTRTETQDEHAVDAWLGGYIRDQLGDFDRQLDAAWQLTAMIDHVAVLAEHARFTCDAQLAGLVAPLEVLAEHLNSHLHGLEHAFQSLVELALPGDQDAADRRPLANRSGEVA